MGQAEDRAEFEKKLHLYKEKMQELSDLQEEIFQHAMKAHKEVSMEEARKKINEIV